MALSPINRRRWQVFKSNKRGFWSAWIFLGLFFLSLFAEGIANDRPLIASYKGEILFPAVVEYPETKFGGFLATTMYNDSFIADEINANGWMVWPPVRYSYATKDETLTVASPPSWMAGRDFDWGAAHWLGTDNQGRDVLARIIYGFRISVLFGLILTLVSSLVGVLAGAVQGYFGGWIDLVMQRGIEVWTAIPALYLLMILSNVLVPSFWVLLVILLLFSWVALVPVVRAEFLRARNLEYVAAARALGVPNRTIMLRHLLPNAMVATLTFMPFLLGGSVTTLTTLDFLGLGLPVGSPSLGELLAQGKDNPQAPWLGLTGFFTISIMLSLLIFAGEAVRDAFDPRKTFR